MNETEWWSSNDPFAMFDCICEKRCYGNTPASMAHIEVKMEMISGILQKAGWCDLHGVILQAREGRSNLFKGPYDYAANLLREVVGNPFRRVTMRFAGFNARIPRHEWAAAVASGEHRPSWAKRHREAWMQAYHMASVIYHEQAFGDLPILADALEDANCRADEENTVPILMHLRGQESRRCLACLEASKRNGMGIRCNAECPGRHRIEPSHIRECWALGLILDLNPR